MSSLIRTIKRAIEREKLGKRGYHTSKKHNTSITVMKQEKKEKLKELALAKRKAENRKHRKETQRRRV